MGVPTSEVGYTSATTGRGDHEVHNGHVVAFEKKQLFVYSAISGRILNFKGWAGFGALFSQMQRDVHMKV
jgi:hypothetical protein